MRISRRAIITVSLTVAALAGGTAAAVTASPANTAPAAATASPVTFYHT